eukprot:3684600-Pleurochrysis_carterae.AAC.1
MPCSGVATQARVPTNGREGKAVIRRASQQILRTKPFIRLMTLLYACPASSLVAPAGVLAG